jgi:hypothetical protein
MSTRMCSFVHSSIEGDQEQDSHRRASRGTAGSWKNCWKVGRQCSRYYVSPPAHATSSVLHYLMASVLSGHKTGNTMDPYKKKPTTRPNYCVPGAVGTRRQKLPPHSGPPSSGRSGLSPDRSDRLGSPRSWYCPESLGMRYVDSSSRNLRCRRARASIPSCFRAVANSSAGYHERVSVPHYAIWSSLRPGESAGDHIKSRGSIPTTRW